MSPPQHPNTSNDFPDYRLPIYIPRITYLPPVRLKEFPKAENELRGVKSGLPGLLTGLHKPELNVTGKYTKWMSVSQQDGHAPRTAASTEGSAVEAKARGDRPRGACIPLGKMPLGVNLCW